MCVCVIPFMMPVAYACCMQVIFSISVVSSMRNETFCKSLCLFQYGLTILLYIYLRTLTHSSLYIYTKCIEEGIFVFIFDSWKPFMVHIHCDTIAFHQLLVTSVVYWMKNNQSTITMKDHTQEYKWKRIWQLTRSQ